MSDFRLAVDFVDHPKTQKLRRRLGADAVLCLLRLWSFAAQRHPDGVLRGLNEEDLEIAARWDAGAGAFVEALVSVGFLDAPADGPLTLHDWSDHQLWLLGAGARKAKAAAAAAARWGYTNRPVGRDDAPSNARSIVSDAPSMPNHARSNAPLLSSPLLKTPPTPPAAQHAGGVSACVGEQIDPRVTHQHAPEGALVRRDPAPPPSASRGPIVDSRPVGGAVAGWSAEGRPLLRCAGQPSEVLQWDYLLATIGEEALVPWLVSPDAARRLSRVHPGSLHRAVEQGIARARPPTIADRLAADAVLDPDPRRQAGLAAASALCAAVGRIEERRARQIAVELATLDLDGDPLSADEVLGGVRAYAAERAVLRRQAKGGQVDPPEVFDVVHAVRRFARDERGKRPTVPTPVVEQPPLQLLGSGASDYAEGADEQAAAAIRRANGLERTDEDHQRGLESVQAVLRALKGGRG